MNPRFLSLLVVLFFPLISMAQYFAPVGAIWHYDQVNIMPPYDQDFVTCEVEKDTTILGLTAQKVVCNRTQITSGGGTATFHVSTRFVRYDSNRVFQWADGPQAFLPLYDFNAQAGDTIGVYCDQALADSILSVVVDSVDTVMINGTALKLQWLRPTEPQECFIGGRVYERIGWEGYLFPQSGFADPPEGGPLRCYQDSILGFYQHNTQFDCDFINSTQEQVPVGQQIKLYPNPTRGVVQVDLPVVGGSQQASFELINTVGALVRTGSLLAGTNQLDLAALPQGIYFLRVLREGQSQLHRVVLME